MESKNAFEIKMQDLNAQIDESESDRASKAENKARKLQVRADAEGDLSKDTSDPCGKIRKMIKDLILRLTVVANDETSHKGWCDTELSTNGLTRKQHLRR